MSNSLVEVKICSWVIEMYFTCPVIYLKYIYLTCDHLTLTVKHLISLTSNFGGFMWRARLRILILALSYFQMYATLYTFIENWILAQFYFGCFYLDRHLCQNKIDSQIYVFYSSMLGKMFNRWQIEIFFLFLPENRFWHFMQIVSNDNFLEI